jgi:hypothetical protein
LQGRVGQFATGAGGDRLAIQGRRLTRCSQPALAEDRLIDHSHHWETFDQQSY